MRSSRNFKEVLEPDLDAGFPKVTEGVFIKNVRGGWICEIMGLPQTTNSKKKLHKYRERRANFFSFYAKKSPLTNRVEPKTISEIIEISVVTSFAAYGWN